MNEYLGNISLTDQWLFCTDLIYFKNFVQNSPVSVPELCILNRHVGIETRANQFILMRNNQKSVFIKKKLYITLRKKNDEKVKTIRNGFIL